MEKIIEYDKSLEMMSIGEGFNGKCYLTQTNEVFKKFNNPSLYEKNIRQITGLLIPTYVFPKQLVVLRNTIIGYIMDYIDGVEIKYLQRTISLKDYINALKMAEKDIAVLTVYGIYSFDLGDSNILYTKDNKIRVIDTDFYKKTKNRKSLYAYNMGNFTHSVLNPIFDIYASKFTDKELQKGLRGLTDGKIAPSGYLSMLLKYMQINEDSINIDEMSNELKLLYKTIE